MAVNTASGFRPDQENVAYIGAGVTIKGEISVPDLIVIDGTIEGNVTARVVCVGQSGVI
ncbi:MAG: polymer-forming cytoskeletal protein, partial [Hyphomicrobiales bacterium]